MEAEALAGLEKLACGALVADFIFLDPPYEKKSEHIRVLEFLDASHLVAPRGVVIVEHIGARKCPSGSTAWNARAKSNRATQCCSFYRLAAAA